MPTPKETRVGVMSIVATHLRTNKNMIAKRFTGLEKRSVEKEM